MTVTLTCKTIADAKRLRELLESLGFKVRPEWNPSPRVIIESEPKAAA